MASENIDELKKERDKANQDTKLTARKNREAINELKTLLAEADKEKQERNKENEKVAKLKPLLAEAEKKARTCREEMDKQSTKLASIPAKDNPLKIQQEIDEMEWIQQTEADSKLERELGKKIKDLRRKLPQAQEFVGVIEQYKTSREELRTSNAEARKIREELRSCVEESEKHHQAMLKIFKKTDGLRKIIGEGFKELDEKREKADEYHKQFIEARQQISESEEEEVKRENQWRHRETEKIKKAISAKAEKILEAFKNGKKISLEEIMILKESGINLSKEKKA